MGGMGRPFPPRVAQLLPRLTLPRREVASEELLRLLGQRRSPTPLDLVQPPPRLHELVVQLAMLRAALLGRIA